jgi:hypothetical protein
MQRRGPEKSRSINGKKRDSGTSNIIGGIGLEFAEIRATSRITLNGRPPSTGNGT